MKTRDWSGYEEHRKRNLKACERFGKEDVKLFLQRAKDVVWSLPPSWEAKRNDRPAYLSRAKRLCCLLKVKFKEDYRSLHSYLSMNGNLLKNMERSKAPSKSVMRKAMARIPQSYFAFNPHFMSLAVASNPVLTPQSGMLFSATMKYYWWKIALRLGRMNGRTMLLKFSKDPSAKS